jgi:hypothetical protein
MLDGTDGFAWEWRTLGDVLANYTLPAGTTFDEACGWAEAFIRDHPGTAVKMHQEKDTSVQVTVYEVLRLVA